MLSQADSSRRVPWETLLLSGSLLLYSVILAPIPAVNEPHYLSKAKHFWQPDWCAGDLFLESANTHTVFYVVVGPLTQWLTLEQTAWVGRALALTLLAFGWIRLGCAVQLPSRTSFMAAWIFLALQTIGNWSGEWIVGGLESKTFSYGLIFWAAAEWLQHRRIYAATLLGLAISFHPVVGMWALLAASGAEVVQWGRTRRIDDHSADASWQTWLIAGCVLVLTAVPGLLPVLDLLLADVDRSAKFDGTYLQVFYRLSHHLDPMQFSTRAFCGYTVLLVFWLAANRRESDRARIWLHLVVGWALVFAICGILLGAGPRPAENMPGFEWRMRLLKFYPFRLFDALLPCACAWMIAGWLSQRILKPRYCALAIVALMSATLGYAQFLAAGSTALERMPDWIDVCQWIREQTPSDVVVQTPHGRHSFKWYAERPEYVSYKDCPQDDAGIVEWNRRMLFLRKWYAVHYDDQFYSSSELQELGRATGITHIVTDRIGPMEPPPTYRNETYRVYDLRTIP